MNQYCSGSTEVWNPPVPKSTWLYIRDMWSALTAWVTVWFVDIEKIKRRIDFLEDLVEEDRKEQFPYRILMAAYNKRLSYAK